MALYSGALNEAIRKAIDLSLDESALPDAVISLSVYGPAAERDVLAADPVAATRTDPDEQQRVKDAVIYYAAARLAPALPALTSERLGDYTYQRSEWDAAKRAAELRALASASLSAYLEPDGVRPTQRQFATAPGYRGR